MEVELPRLTRPKSRLAKAIAAGDDVDALIAEPKTTQQERRDAEARLAHLEGVERDLRPDEDQVAQFERQWAEWSKLSTRSPATLRSLACQPKRTAVSSAVVRTPRIGATC